MCSAEYFEEIAAATETFSRRIDEIRQLSLAAETIGLSWSQCCRAFGDDFLEAETTYADRCSAAAKRYGLHITETKQ